jgi:hypothetical protein
VTGYGGPATATLQTRAIAATVYIVRIIRLDILSLSLLCGAQKRQNPPRVNYWEIIADNLSKAGSSWSCVATVDRKGRTMFVADAHCDDGRRFVVRADQKLNAFLELESAIRPCGDLS